MTLLQQLKIFYKKNGRRHLPWRQTRDPYKILVSEIMLQQTQVDRVMPKYAAFIATFPKVQNLAAATFPEVLALWSGLGYNRRAKFLHEAAKAVVEGGGAFPRTTEALEKLPGVGPYTARAITTFVLNKPEVFIETNIRTVFTHFYFKDKEGVVDIDLLPLIAIDLKKSKMEPRDFYAALMDYGSMLKQSGIRINNKSKHYTKQPTFVGSRRELRGAILKVLLNRLANASELYQIFAHTKICESFNEVDIEKELAVLLKENFLQKKGKKYEIKK